MGSELSEKSIARPIGFLIIAEREKSIISYFTTNVTSHDRANFTALMVFMLILFVLFILVLSISFAD